jgi:spore coat polysaccharide biosynthesis predicted glycosyltransferase SpsG
MTRDPVLIRVDANPRVGYEHLSRCLTFAAALQRRRRTTYFLSQLEPASLGLNIKRAGNEWLDAGCEAGSPDDLVETIQEIRRLGPAAVVVDAPQLAQGYLTELMGCANLVTAIDHYANTRFPTQLVVNPLLAPDKESYEHVPGTQLLLGARYALVRPEIRRLRQGRAQEPPPLPAANGKSTSGQYRVLLALGEDDPNRQTLALAKLLLNTPRVARVDVVARIWHPNLEALQALAATQPERLEIAVEPAEVTARVSRCHFALTSGSGWSLELACVGIPQLLIVQTEAHWPSAQRLEEEGCATCLGWHANVSPASIRQGVQNLLNDPLERQAMARCARKLIDGRGPDRLVTALEVMLHPSRQVDFSSEAA